MIWFIYCVWMVALLVFVGENVSFPSREIERLFVFIFVLGSGLIAAFFESLKVKNRR